MVTQQKFDELVKNCERVLTEMKAKMLDLEKRLAHMENRKKPGPKPKGEEQEAA